MAGDWDMTEMSQQELQSSVICSRWPAVPADMAVGWWWSVSEDPTQPFPLHVGKMGEVRAVLRKQQCLATSRKSLPD